MNYVSIFSGIEAASAAWRPLGWQPVVFSEIDKFASKLLAHHYPEVPNIGDITEHDWSQYRGKVDVVVGGSPCQAFSVAGLRGSLSDARGNLSLEFVKAIHAIRPRFAVIENVPGWLSTKDNAFGCFLGGLVGADDALCLLRGARRWPDAGMVAGPKSRLAWRVLDAQYFGLAQRRRRVFVVAGFGDGADPAKVLFEPQGMQGNPAPRRQARENLAPTISARTKGGGGLGTDFDLDGGLIAHSLRAEGFDASEDGTGRGTPIVPICFDCKAGGNTGFAIGDIPGALRGAGHGGGHAAVAARLAVPEPFTLAIRGRGGSSDLEARQDGLANALMTPNGGRAGIGIGAIATKLAVRRLTPRECERLMGFEDCYTAIPGASDGARYKAIGNSMAVPVMRWIGERIQDRSFF